jgi:hypothetical protein
MSRYAVASLRRPFYHTFMLSSMISLLRMWRARPSSAASFESFDGDDGCLAGSLTGRDIRGQTPAGFCPTLALLYPETSDVVKFVVHYI